MGKKLSPAFSVVVIVIALMLGALYFMYRYREHERQWQADKVVLTAEARSAEAMRRTRGSGRGMPFRRGRMARSRGERPGAPAQPKKDEGKSAERRGR